MRISFFWLQELQPAWPSRSDRSFHALTLRTLLVLRVQNFSVPPSSPFSTTVSVLAKFAARALAIMSGSALAMMWYAGQLGRIAQAPIIAKAAALPAQPAQPTKASLKKVKKTLSKKRQETAKKLEKLLINNNPPSNLALFLEDQQIPLIQPEDIHPVEANLPLLSLYSSWLKGVGLWSHMIVSSRQVAGYVRNLYNEDDFYRGSLCGT